MNYFIQFPDTFPEFGKEMILDAVICSAWDTFGNVDPFISHIIMKFIKL